MNKALSLLLVLLTINTTSIECMQMHHSAASSPYLSEIAPMWRDRLVQEVWSSKIQRPAQHHSVEEFIGRLVRCAREGGTDEVIAFLEEAEEWGFALDSVFYSENNGPSQLLLRHLIIFDTLFKDKFMESLTEKMQNIHSIVSDNDVKASSYTFNSTCFNNVFHYILISAWTIILEIPPTLSKIVTIDIARQHH